MLKRTPLMWAAENDRRDVVAKLLAVGEDVRVADVFGETALHVACIRSSVPTIELFLSRPETDVDAVNCFGHNALDAAIVHGRYDVVDLLLKRGARPSTRTAGLVQTYLKVGHVFPRLRTHLRSTF